MSGGEVVICFLFFSIIIGALTTYLLSRIATQLPYTVVVFVLGVIISLGLVNEAGTDSLKEGMLAWNSIEPTLILYIFLPVLLFGEAMSLNFHHVQGAINSAMLLAGPGAVFGTFLVAVLVKYTFPYNWSWQICFVLGAILCATDPVAVVALLKSAGASNRMTYLIIGESLLNDGSALVLYNLLFQLITPDSEPLTVPYVVEYFAQVIFISPLLGLAFGLVALFFLSIANNNLKEDDHSVQMAITISCAYLSFFVAENSLNVSGVITCCTAGVVLARFAPPLILNQESLHNVWSAFEWVGNTFIFTLAGVLLGARSFYYLSYGDIPYIILTYVFITVVRVVMIVIFFPIMARIGDKTTIQEAMFMSWSGLRGAVGIALALSLSHDVLQGNTVLSNRDGETIFFLVGGVAAMTLAINATFSNHILTWLHLLEDPEAIGSKIMRVYLKKRIFVSISNLLKDLIDSDPYFNRQIAAHYCSIFKDEKFIEINCNSLSSSKMDDEVVSPGRVKSMVHLTVPSKDITPMHHSKAIDVNILRNRKYPSKSWAYQSAFSTIGLSLDHPQQSHPSIQAQHSIVERLRNLPANNDVLAQIRRSFLEVVRVRYWKIIHSGKLPRHSSATTILLSSIDIGIEGLFSIGLQDWDAIVQRMPELWKATLIERNLKHKSITNIFESTGLNSNPSNQWTYLIFKRCASLMRRMFRREEPMQPNEPVSHKIYSVSIDLSNVHSIEIEGNGHDHTLPLEECIENVGNSMESNKIPEFSMDEDELKDEEFEAEKVHQSQLMASRIRQNTLVNFNMMDEETIELDDIDNKDDHPPKPSEPSVYPTTPAVTTSWWKRFSKQFNTMIDLHEISERIAILVCFIEAHQHAQKKITFYLGEEEVIGTPEEATVIAESCKVVNEAINRLLEIDANMITTIVSRQDSILILHTQQNLIQNFIQEGLITEHDAKELLDEVEVDLMKLQPSRLNDSLLTIAIWIRERFRYFYQMGVTWTAHCHQCMDYNVENQ